MLSRRRLLRNLIVAGTTPVALSATGSLGWAALFPTDAANDYPLKYPRVNRPGIALGAYDPSGNFKDYPGVSIEHVFMPWQDVDLSSLLSADRYARERRRQLLITIEPWSWSEDSHPTADQLRDAMLAGHHDERIRSIARVVAQLKSPVTLRWGQEMEEANNPFPWSGWKPTDYIAAYRRFHDISSPIALTAKFMWSPKGNANLADYYPGDAYADSIGLSIFGYQKYDRTVFGAERQFADVLGLCYHYTSLYGKEIVVAECGYAGDPTYVGHWAHAITKKDPRFPLLSAVVYFDDVESTPWPGSGDLPDWRVG
jgi:beta-mannanase